MLLTILPTAPAEGYSEALLPLDDAKAWIKVDGDGENDLIKALRDAAIDMIERHVDKKLAPVSGLIATAASFVYDGSPMRLAIGPAATVAITAIGYADASGTRVSLAPTDWRGDGAGVLPASSWPSDASAVTVTFDAGFPTGATPPMLIHAARMLVAHFYRNREAAAGGSLAEMPFGVRAMCAPYRELTI